MAYTPDNPWIVGDPYSYDLNWLVARVKELLNNYAGLQTEQAAIRADFSELKSYVENYFDELDISAEVADKINELYEAGFFDQIIEDWLEDHIKWSNDNLLDNPWFTVNQRGFTSGNSNQIFTVDRWKLQGSGEGSVTLNSDNSITLTGGSAYLSYQQTLPLEKAYIGRTITVSALDSDGNLYAATGVLSAPTGSIQTIARASIGTNADITLYMQPSSVNAVLIQFRAFAGRSVTIKAVKLEFGYYSTLANDAPPNYAEELTKCQLYCRALKFAGASYFTMAYNAAATVARFSLPFTMRAVPSLTFSGTFTILSGGSEHAISGFSVTGNTNDVIPISATTTGLTTNETGLVKAESGSVIILSADL